MDIKLDLKDMDGPKFFSAKNKRKENAYVAGIFDFVKSLVTGADDRVYLATR